MTNHPNRSRCYAIITREQRGQNMLVHFTRNGERGCALFDRCPWKWETRAADLFFGISDINDDALVIRALKYLDAR